MNIKGHEITVIENRAGDPWPLAINYDGRRMEYNSRWENTPRGQVIYYKSPDDTSAFQGVGVLRKDLRRLVSGE